MPRMEADDVRAALEALVRDALRQDGLCGGVVPTFNVSQGRVQGNYLDTAKETWRVSAHAFATRQEIVDSLDVHKRIASVVAKAGRVLLDQGAEQVGDSIQASSLTVQNVPARTAILSPWRAD